MSDSSGVPVGNPMKDVSGYLAGEVPLEVAAASLVRYFKARSPLRNSQPESAEAYRSLASLLSQATDEERLASTPTIRPIRDPSLEERTRALEQAATRLMFDESQAGAS